MGSNFVLPTLLTMYRGRFTVDRRNKSPLLNKITFDLPFLSASRFCRSTASAIESCKKRTTVSRASINLSSDSLSLATVLLECTVSKSLVASVIVSLDTLGVMLIWSVSWGAKSVLALTFLFSTEVDVIYMGVEHDDRVVST